MFRFFSGGSSATAVVRVVRLRGCRFRAGERQLDLEHLLIDLGDVVYLVDPDVAAGAGGLIACASA
jgi:hypothetical protein